MVVDQTESQQIVKDRPEDEAAEMVRGPENTLKKECSIRDQFWWIEKSCIKDWWENQT